MTLAQGKTWSFPERLARYMHDPEWITGWKLPKPGTYLLTGSTSWADYAMSLRMRSDDNDGIGVMVGYTDAGNYYRFSMETE